MKHLAEMLNLTHGEISMIEKLKRIVSFLIQ